MFATLGAWRYETQQSFDDLGTPLHQVTFVVLDVETTGGSPAIASLTEVAAARFRGGELLGTYQTLVRPDERIPPLIIALTGITDAMVSGAPRVGEMLPSLIEFIGGAVLVGHNLRFDLAFLDHALVSTGRDRLTNARVDTLALSRRLVRDMVPNCKLGTLASTLRLPHQPSHRALADVLATGDLLHALLERAGSFGIVELEELLHLTSLLGHPQARETPAHHPASPPTGRLLVRRRCRARPLCGKGHRPTGAGPLVFHRRQASQGGAAASPAPCRRTSGVPRAALGGGDRRPAHQGMVA